MENVKLVSIMVFTKKIKTKEGKTFIRHSTKYNAKVNGKRKSLYYDVKFTDDAFNGTTLTEKDIKRGILEVESKCIGCPDSVIERTNEKGTNYYVVLNEKGEDTRPTCWIRGGIHSFKAIEKEHEFNFNVDEKETESTEIDDVQE